MPVANLRSVAVVATSLAALSTSTGHLAAQQSCRYADTGNDLYVTRGPFTYITNPHLLCNADQVEIAADSAVANTEQGMFLLIRAVHYRDGARELESEEARYFYRVGRIQAQGGVRVTNHEDGSTVENGDLVLLRQTETRDVEEMTFTIGDDGIRPRATVYPKRPPPPPDTVSTAPDAAMETPDADSTGLALDSLALDSLATGGVAAADSALATPDSAAIASPEPTPEPPEPERIVPEEPAEPQEYIMVGDRLFFRGDSYFNAVGTVEITRDSLFAFADSAEYDGDLGELRLEGSARVESNSYDLVGRRITMVSASDGSDEIRALRDAVLTGEDLEVTAPQVVLHMADGDLQRMVAVPLPEPDSVAPDPRRPRAPSAPATPDSTSEDSTAAPGQPRAVAQDFELTADSLDLSAPGGELDRIFAAGRAHSISNTRSELNVEALPELARTDWMDADTIEVFLATDTTAAPGAVADSASAPGGYTVDRIVARVRAHALYRLVPSDSTAVAGVDPPAVSYLLANEITIFMDDGQADRVESVGQVSGWHLEPLKRSAEPTDDDADAASDDPADPISDVPSPDPSSAPVNPGGDGA